MVVWYEFLCGPVTAIPRDTMIAAAAICAGATLATNHREDFALFVADGLHLHERS